MTGGLQRPFRNYFGVTLRFSCIFAAAFFFIICNLLSADISIDDDTCFPLPPAAFAAAAKLPLPLPPVPPPFPFPGTALDPGATALGADEDTAPLPLLFRDGAESPPAPLLPFPGRAAAGTVVVPALAAAMARLESPEKDDGTDLVAFEAEEEEDEADDKGGLRGFGLLRLAASPARPMGLFGPPPEDSAGTLSSERLNGCDARGGGVSGLVGGVSSRETPNTGFEAGFAGFVAIFFIFFVHLAQYHTKRGSLTS